MNKMKNLIDRDSLGEKIIFLYQDQVDKLIEIIESIPEDPFLQVGVVHYRRETKHVERI